jgi:uncharacterized damage-inducible protein DinB
MVLKYIILCARYLTSVDFQKSTVKSKYFFIFTIMNEDLLAQFKKTEDLFRSYLKDTEGLTEQQFNYSPASGAWSIAQVLYHTWLAVDFTQTYVSKKLAKGDIKQQSGIKSQLASTLLKIALSSPFKFNAPKATKDSVPQYATHQELSDKADKTFAAMKQMLKNFPKELRTVTIFRHPVIGLINISQTMDFLETHTAHHKMQIDRLLKEIHE